MLKNKLGALALRIIATLPLPVARVLAIGLANCMKITGSKAYRISAINLKLTHPELPEQALNKVTGRSIESTLINALEMPIIWRNSNKWLKKKIFHIHGEQHIRNALNNGTGVIAICPHVGNWEVFGRYLPQIAATTNLYQPPKYTFLENLVKRGREQSGAALVPTSQRGIAQLFKALHRGEIIGILPDQVPKNDSGIFVPFFGVPALTMTLVHKLVQRTGCKVVLGYALREGRGFAIYFKPAPEAIYSEDEISSVTALSQMVEMSTHEDLSQYQWAYKRFKLQPDGTRHYKR